MIIRISAFLSFFLLLPLHLHAESNFRIEFEGGAAWIPKNDVQIPNDDEGTRFSIDKLGKGAFATGRVLMEWDPWELHGFKLLIAPLRYQQTGRYEKDINFQDQTYSAGEEINTTYRFNSYRLGYRYKFYSGYRWVLRAGGTLKVRDAKIQLSNGNSYSEKKDLGVVPLLNFRADYRITPQVTAIFDSDFLAAPQGRAFDLALLTRYKINSSWDLSVGYRFLDGGADNDEVYTFAQVHYAIMQVGYRFNC